MLCNSYVINSCVPNSLNFLFLCFEFLRSKQALKGKTKVQTSTKSKEAGTVDPKMQISADEYREIETRRDKQKSRYEQGGTSKAGATRPRVTSQILLNKWQRQKEKDYQRWLKDQEYQRQLERERYERKQAESHWNCPFFRHC